ncbi:MAG: RNA polymerase subunit sigma-70, partial [Candidatus Kerfeldbacteria bacterium]|nr:RNA polymerase subunit sigma-70 [Candidatus Kerfeldbacteria bacterium]
MTEHEFLRHYEQFADAIFRHCYYRVFDAEQAHDLVQETFLRTWQYLVSGHQIDRIRPFLYRT